MEVNKIQTVVLYSRVDTSCSPEDPLNDLKLLSQMNSLRCIADKQGFRIISEFWDVASGKSIERPGLNAMLNAIGKEHCDAVIVCDFNQLASNMGDLQHLGIVFEHFGVDVYSIEGHSFVEMSDAYIALTKIYSELNEKNV